MEKINLQAQLRDVIGKQVKSLRTQGIIPAVVFGKGIESMPVSVMADDFKPVLKEAGQSTLVELALSDQEPIHVIISDLNYHPVSGDILHVNFRKVSLKEKIKAMVPLTVEGESPAVKLGEGNVLVLHHEIEVECLPQDIPHEFVIDVTSLENVDDTVFAKDLQFDRSKVTLELEDDEAIVKISAVEEEEVEEEVTEEALIEGVEATEETESAEEGAEPADKSEKKE